MTDEDTKPAASVEAGRLAVWLGTNGVHLGFPVQREELADRLAGEGVAPVDLEDLKQLLKHNNQKADDSRLACLLSAWLSKKSAADIASSIDDWRKHRPANRSLKQFGEGQWQKADTSHPARDRRLCFALITIEGKSAQVAVDAVRNSGGPVITTDEAQWLADEEAAARTNPG